MQAVDGETTMNTWFTEIFHHFFTGDIFQKSFREVVESAMQWMNNHSDYAWPISDLIHLFKCGRAHVQGHLTCVDPDHFICVNIELLKQATGLHSNLENRTTQARMNDQFALELFSYDSFIELLKHQRYDAVMYVFPFMCLNEAVRSQFATKEERLGFLGMAYKAFLFQLRNANLYAGSTMFPMSYHKNAIGTLFGEKIYIQRCICTTVAIGIGLLLPIPNIGLGRLGTHDIEGIFGTMRILQHDYNTVGRGLHAAVKTNILAENNKNLNISLDIRTRINKAGTKIDWETYKPEENIQINPNLLPNVVYCLMIGSPIDMKVVDNVIMQLNNYTSRYSLSPTTKVSKHAVLTSAKPFARYLSVGAYKLSTTPIPQDIANERANSLIGYYFQKKDINDEIQRIKIQKLTNIILQNLQQQLTTQKITTFKRG